MLPPANPVYITYLGGSGDDGAYSIAVDGAGNAYVTGFTDSTNFPTTNAIPSFTQTSAERSAKVLALIRLTPS